MIIDDPELDAGLAADGDPAACVRMVRRARRSGEPDMSQLMSWARTAAEAGHPPGMVALAVILHDRGEATARAEGDDWLRRAAATGHAPACFRWGRRCRQRGNRAEARRWLERAVAGGYEQALPQLLITLWLPDGKELPDQEWIEAGSRWWRRIDDPRGRARLRYTRTSLVGGLYDVALREALAGRLADDHPLGRLAGPPSWAVRDRGAAPLVIDFVPVGKPAIMISSQVDELVGRGWDTLLITEQDLPDGVLAHHTCEALTVDPDRPDPRQLTSDVLARLAGRHDDRTR